MTQRIIKPLFYIKGVTLDKRKPYSAQMSQVITNLNCMQSRETALSGL